MYLCLRLQGCSATLVCLRRVALFGFAFWIGQGKKLCLVFLGTWNMCDGVMDDTMDTYKGFFFLLGFYFSLFFSGKGIGNTYREY